MADERPNYDEILRSIEEFARRTIYTSLDEETLGAIEDAKLEQAIVDFVIHKIGEDFDHEYELVTALPAPIQDVYTTWVLENEVENGGFNQYFWNSSGQFAEEVSAGLDRMEAHAHADIVRNAMNTILAAGEAWGKFRRTGTLEAFSGSYDESTLAELDRAFEEAGPLSPLRIRYIRRRPSAFVA